MEIQIKSYKEVDVIMDVIKYTELKEIQEKLKLEGVRTEIVKLPSCDGWKYKLYDFRSNIPMELFIKKR